MLLWKKGFKMLGFTNGGLSLEGLHNFRLPHSSMCRQIKKSLLAILRKHVSILRTVIIIFFTNLLGFCLEMTITAAFWGGWRGKGGEAAFSSPTPPVKLAIAVISNAAQRSEKSL